MIPFIVMKHTTTVPNAIHGYKTGHVNMGHRCVQKWPKTMFSKFVPRPLGVLKKCFWPVVSPWWPVMTLHNSKKTNKGQNWLKNAIF